MSLFLVYFEIGASPIPEQPGPPIVTKPITCKLEQTGKRRAGVGLLMTDGHSSERFLVYNQKSTGREGHRLRTALHAFITARSAPERAQFIATYISHADPAGTIPMFTSGGLLRVDDILQ